MGKFKKGDLVKGKGDNYGITNYNMYKAEVIKISDDEDEMELKILDHNWKKEIGSTYWVSNDDTWFEFIGANLPKEYYFNKTKKTVVLKWNDGTITKVKASKDDKFNERYGFLIAYFQKQSGMSKTKANKYIDSLLIEKEK